MKKTKKIIIILIVLLFAGIIARLIWQQCFYEKKQIVFKSDKVEEGDLFSTISASGTVEPEELVNVGVQVSGKIMSFGTDAEGKTVDYGSKVKRGMVLAQIDDVLYDAALREAKASKLQAQAAILSSKASIRQNKAKLVLAQRNWNRAKELFPKGAMSRSDYDGFEAANIAGEADIAAAEAALEQAKAQLAIAEAALVKAQRNMDYCVITSPVDGIIIDRRVSVGQTVVSNMSASSIFLIAKEFKKMQVWVSVNEADIGNIKVGMPVVFTVDAFRNAEFRGTVHKIRLNATMSQNVVTYIVEVVTDNKEGKLIPYLTANVKFILNQRKQVLNVANAVLRYYPPKNLIAPEYLKKLDDFAINGRERLVWKRNSKNQLYPVKVTTGLTTGVRVEIVSGDLKKGDEIIFGASETTVANTENANSAGSPFLPKPPQRKGSGTAGKRAAAAR